MEIFMLLRCLNAKAPPRPLCWYCPFQQLSGLKKLHRHHPDLWEQLREMEQKVKTPSEKYILSCFTQGWSVEQLEQRFDCEDRQLSLFDVME